MTLLTFLFLLLAAAVGHAALWVHANNWLHSLRPHTEPMKLLRGLCHLANAGGILGFAAAFGLPLARGGGWLELPLPLLGYLAVCWGLGLAYVPFMLFRRWTRRTPPQQIRFSSQVLNVEKQLGHPPRGGSRRSFLAPLPWNEIYQVELTERELALPNLPPMWEGLTLLHLTDLHLCGCPDQEFFAAVMERLAKEPADLLLLTGDLVDTDRHYHWLKPLLGRLRWRHGAFAVLGNHDSWFDADLVRKELRELQIEPVGGRWLQAEVKGTPLIVVGNEAPWIGGPPDLSACPRGLFRLCLSHSPDQLPWAKRAGIDLMVAGHTHGGQIRIPGVGSVFVPSRYSGRYDCGLFWEAPTLLFVGRGLSGTTPVRYRCKPEVARLTLRRCSQA